MIIYVSHSRNFDFQNELYKPIKKSPFVKEHQFIFPHKDSDKPFNTKELLEEKKCDLVVAEVSYPATGQGIELGWADAFGIPVICFSKIGVKISGSLKIITDKFVEYEDSNDLVHKLQTQLS